MAPYSELDTHDVDVDLQDFFFSRMLSGTD